MSVRLEVEQDDDREILTVYLGLTDEPIAQTIEIEHGQILIDESSDGEVVGIELIRPKDVRLAIKHVADQYQLPELLNAVENLLAAV